MTPQEPNGMHEQLLLSLHQITTAWPNMLPVLPRRPIGPTVNMAMGTRPPAPITVLSLRRQTCEQLAAWCLLIITDRDLKHANLDRTNVYGMCDFLIRHADWLAHLDAAELAVTQIGQAAARCKDVAEDLRRRRFKVGPCIEHTTSDAGGRLPCQGTIVAYLSNEQTMLPWLHCDADDNHSWDGSQWGQLGKHVCTIREAARITGIPERTIRQWVDDGHVEPVVRSRPVLIRLEQVTNRRDVA